MDKWFLPIEIIIVKANKTGVAGFLIFTIALCYYNKLIAMMPSPSQLSLLEALVDFDITMFNTSPRSALL